MIAALLMVACAAGPPEPQAPSPAVMRGRTLFANKGCATCHTNRRAEAGAALNVGPDLTTYRNDAAFLQRWLADPAAVRPGTNMPKLNLSSQEIADLIAFLNQAR